MDRLWAPWRGQYILEAAAAERGQSAPREGCIFCTLPAAGAEAARENLILSAGEQAFVIMNRYPYNNGHLMVVPRRHVAELSALDAADYRVLCELLRRTSAALAKVMQPDGINLGMNLGRSAGAGIADHCHFHLVPRWNGDTNFMPVVGQTKVLSFGLEQTYDQLVPEIADLALTVEEELR
ncbi:MAG: HIT domain-containing protein [Deltaproteobacteria bacterium]|nr:HIT domain-containing protein [Deltaproteobacteria bacterium]